MKRFTAALERLETSAGVAMSQAAGEWRRRSPMCVSSCARASRNWKTRIARFAGLTEEVEGRLDGAIGEIRAALGRN